MIKINRFKQFFNTHSYTQEEQFLKEKITLLNVTLLLMAVNVFFFSIYRYINENYLQSGVDFLFSISLVVGFIFLARDKSHFLNVSRFLIFFATTVVFTVIVHFPLVDTRFSWLSLIVYLIFYLLNMREAKIWFSTLLVALLALYAINIIDITVAELVVFIVTTLFLAVFLVQYEAIKKESQEFFLNHNRELEERVEQKVAELKEQKDMFEHLFLKSHDGTLLIENRKFIKCNDAVVDMFGYTKVEELLTIGIEDLSAEYQPNSISSKIKSEQILQTCFLDGASNFEWLSKRADGKLFWCDITLTHLKLNSKDIIHAVFRDISDKKTLELENKKMYENLESEVQNRTQELQIALKTKNEFLANMSHEIRTPLNAVVGFVDILIKKEEDAKKLKYLKIIQNSSQSLLEIIKDILDFSQIESSSVELVKVPFIASKPFEESYQIFSKKAKEREISLVLEIEKSMPKELFGDALRVKQIVSNILGNAIKFTPKEGKVSIVVGYDLENKKLHCTIEDNGIGIKKENLEKIFDSFSQADNSTTRKYGGTGLGLSISKSLVELMGGSLNIKSQEEVGTVVSFEIKI